MTPAQDFLLTTPVRRSPSPVLPGAWPLSTNTPNNMHKRSSTCPTLFEPSNIFASSAYSNSLHLDHVRNFHQRLSLSLSRSPGPSDICNTTTTFLPSESTSSSLSPNALGSTPLSGSDLTQNNTNTPFLAFVVRIIIYHLPCQHILIIRIRIPRQPLHTKPPRRISYH
ncbi:hypothetical protein BDZ94DRAFT_877137 [Collybia nuda]|uniref:Uncharacterized protein n=1 Tax=Collybia nuda TaxID=64659 RepID=A0A9P5Y3X5_9AGAR|nr:hypothetical protein BDZ94DRAFT_877137 [Collybia nuda]